MRATREGELREKVCKIARVLSIIFVADGIFMLWPLAAGGYAWLTYGQLSYLPLFFPAFFVGLVIAAIYAHGFARRSWTVRRSERLFFVLFVLAVGAKVAVFIKGHRDDQRGAAQDAVGEHPGQRAGLSALGLRPVPDTAQNSVPAATTGRLKLAARRHPV